MANRSSSRTKQTSPRDPLKEAIYAVRRRHGRFGGGQLKVACNEETPTVPSRAPASPSKFLEPPAIVSEIPESVSDQPTSTLGSPVVAPTPELSRSSWWERIGDWRDAGEVWCSRIDAMITRLLNWLRWPAVAFVLVWLVKSTMDWFFGLL